MRKYGFPVFMALAVLAGCSGEAYVSVSNETASAILVSVNNEPNVVLSPGDTTDSYTVTVMKGMVNSIPVDATGDWIGNYSGTAAVTDGEHSVHRIQPTLAEVNIVNTSVDTASCRPEGYERFFFDGSDSLHGKLAVDGSVVLDYSGRYIFTGSSTESWFPGSEYRYELVPDACEIELDNAHPVWTIYYVYISPSTASEWGDDRLGDDILSAGEAYVWRAPGDVAYDMRVEAGDPHPDSVLYAYEFYDTEGCPSDFTWIYEFPAIFTAVTQTSSSKTAPAAETVMKRHALNKPAYYPEIRIEKIRKSEAGTAGEKAKRK